MKVVWGFDIRLNTASVFDKNQTAMTTDQPSEALPIVHELRNPKGHGFDCMVFDGLYLFVPPPFMLKGETAEKRLQSIQEIELNDDDVIICAYPKCGTHWLWEVVEMLRSGVIEYRKEVKETQEFEIIYKEGTDALPAPRTLNTHLPLRMLPKQVVEKKVKCIKIIRNPKDVCVSFFNQYRDTVAPAGFEGDLEEFTELFLYGKICFGAYSDYLLTWKAELARSPGLPVLEMFYEEMKMDPVKSVKNVARFLGLTSTDQFCEDVAFACSFKKMKQLDKEAKEEYAVAKFWKEGSVGFYRKGEVGDWKNWYTVSESEKFDRIWNDQMKDSGIKFTYA
ncbi:sulfotransferase 1B1-like isoform X2 [Haliotis rufescens]|uniref:sulfotransferase 1B1-like isoform X2 n=1 Tax=Haliotis rufescens TaxID=6454 RepID=UPI00201F7EEA|nr:sulfotransferase 1B1-like isoform X2 [Haliotis rufescens]